MECNYKGCKKNENQNTIVCIDGYGFYCEEHMEENFISCPHCENITEIPLKSQPCTCHWCGKSLEGCFI